MSTTQTAALPSAFKRIAWSNLLAQFAEQIALAAAPLTAVLLLSAGAVETGWLQTAQTLPFLLLSIPAGLMADRTSRRALMVGSEAIRALSLALVVALLIFGGLDLRLLAVLGFVGAIGTVCYSVAAPALVPSIVPRAQLGDANRWLELARSSAYTAGPALGGALVGSIGAPTAYILATMLSLAAVAFLAGLPREERAPTEQRRMLHDLQEGALFILRHELMRPILITAIFFNTGWFILQAIYVAYAVQTLGMTASEVGVTLGIFGAGMVLGAMLTPIISRNVSFGTLIILGPISGLLAAVAMLLTLWLPFAWLAALSYFLFGVGPILWTISTVTLRQAVTANAMLGRVSAFFMTATWGARPIGAAIGALVAAHWGVPACLIVATAAFAIQLVVIATSTVSKLQELPQAA